ncbi:YlxR family protein [Puerhibacterium sp. TATVAM-FAB25]|uniref:YlxR family protein n=1 Tax=Puerhibacterium sp. TATVAM-FAB25 TaxID=3093699 RepID=UPI000AE17D56
MRTCVGCRERDLRSALLRLVLAPATTAPPSSPEGGPAVVVDERKALPGRGAWLHPDRACLDLAVRRRAVPRALRTAGPLDLETVRDYLERHGR